MLRKNCTLVDRARQERRMVVVEISDEMTVSVVTVDASASPSTEVIVPSRDTSLRLHWSALFSGEASAPEGSALHVAEVEMRENANAQRVDGYVHAAENGMVLVALALMGWVQIWEPS